MNLLKSKKGNISTKMINGAVIAIVFLVILFVIYSVLVPEAQTAGNSMNFSNKCNTLSGCIFNHTDDVCTNGTTEVQCTNALAATPLAGLFSGTGLVFVLIMAALIILIVKAYLPKGK